MKIFWSSFLLILVVMACGMGILVLQSMLDQPRQRPHAEPLAGPRQAHASAALPVRQPHPSAVLASTGGAR